MPGQRDSSGESSIIFERYDMIIPVYEVGQFVRLKPFPSGADGIRCICNPDKESVVKPLPITCLLYTSDAADE